jgi:hypothetical protein
MCRAAGSAHIHLLVSAPGLGIFTLLCFCFFFTKLQLTLRPDMEVGLFLQPLTQENEAEDQDQEYRRRESENDEGHNPLPCEPIKPVLKVVYRLVGTQGVIGVTRGCGRNGNE